MAATSSVRGDQSNAVFQVLNAATQAPGWNFNKYLVSANGDVITHFPPLPNPAEESWKPPFARHRQTTRGPVAACGGP